MSISSQLKLNSNLKSKEKRNQKKEKNKENRKPTFAWAETGPAAHSALSLSRPKSMCSARAHLVHLTCGAESSVADSPTSPLMVDWRREIGGKSLQTESPCFYIWRPAPTYDALVMGSPTLISVFCWAIVPCQEKTKRGSFDTEVAGAEHAIRRLSNLEAGLGWFTAIHQVWV
jgi:hypothetical protein